MPFELRYDFENKFLVIAVKGQFPLAEFTDLMEAIAHSKEYPPDVPTLWDARLVDLSSFNTNTAMSIIEIRKRYPERGNAKQAIIVSSELAFGTGRMYEMLSGSMFENIMVFRDYDKGIQWLLGNE